MNRHLIAVVDDEIELLETFRALLEEQYEVESFSAPTAFLAALPDLRARNCRLLITDYRMPGMNALEMVRKAHAEIPELPFIILSGFLDKKTVLEAVKMGVFRLLEKPSNHRELLATVDQLLAESELEAVRSEIRLLTSQLRELYSSIRLVLTQYIPDEVMDRLVIDAPNGTVKQKMSFEDLLEKLEHRLDYLLKFEKMINDLKIQKKTVESKTS